MDIAGASNRSIYAADNGVVIQAGYDHGGYGNRIIINHNNGYETTYNHLSQIDVHVGETVRQGQTIGIMGKQVMLQVSIFILKYIRTSS